MTMDKAEIDTWHTLKEVCKRFLGMHEEPQRKRILESLIKRYQEHGCNLPRFLHTPLSFFPRNTGDLNDEHRERLHEFIASM